VVERALREEPAILPEERGLFLVEPVTATELSTLARPAARLCGAARVLARHLDELASPARTRLLAEMDQAADALARALLREEGDTESPADDLEELLVLRCSCL
jgi:hypothetical protein